MHRTAAAFAHPRRLAKNLGHQRLQIRTLADGMAVGAVGARHVVILAQSHAGADDGRLLADARMARTGHLAFIAASGDGLLEAAKSPVPNPAEEEAREIGDMIEIATWYHTLIPPKLSRALDGVFEKDGLDDVPPGVLAETRQHDANGSARVVLLAIERSIAAWTRLRTLVPAQGDAILYRRGPLDRMRGGIHLIRPGAQHFPLAFLGEFSEPPTNA